MTRKLLGRGWKVAIGPDTAAGGGTYPPDPNSNAYGCFTNHVLNALPDLNANPGGANYGLFQVFDLNRTTVSGVDVLGPSGWGNAAPPYYADSIHFSENGRRAAVTGGDTPQFDYAAAVKALLGGS